MSAGRQRLAALAALLLLAGLAGSGCSLLRRAALDQRIQRDWTPAFAGVTTVERFETP